MISIWFLQNSVIDWIILLALVWNTWLLSSIILTFKYPKTLYKAFKSSVA